MGSKRKVTRNIEASDIYLFDMFDEFIEYKETQNLAAATLSNYKTTFRIFCEYLKFDEKTTASSVDEYYVIKWISHLNKADISANSVNHYIRDIKTLLYWGMEREYVPQYKIRTVKAQEEQIKVLADEEIATLLEKPSKRASYTEWRTYTIIAFILGTGARPATIANLTIGDVDFKSKEIKFRHMKTRQALTVPLSKSLETILKSFIKMWRDDSNKEQYVFSNVGDEQLTTNAIRLAYTRYCLDRGLKQTSIYVLRHTFARNWIRAGGNIYVLKDVMGHKSITMTQRYVRLFGQDLKKNFEDFAALDNFKKASSRTKKVERNC